MTKKTVNDCITEADGLNILASGHDVIYQQRYKRNPEQIKSHPTYKFFNEIRELLSVGEYLVAMDIFDNDVLEMSEYDQTVIIEALLEWFTNNRKITRKSLEIPQVEFIVRRFITDYFAKEKSYGKL